VIKFFFQCSNSGINESTPQTQSYVIWMSSKAELGIPSLNSLLEKSGKVFRKLILRPVLLRFEREQNETRKGDPQKKSTEGLENGVANVDGLAKTL